MSETNSTYSEWHDSQKPALNLLQKLGWQYISPKESEAEREDLLSNVILEGILRERLEVLNSFEYKGREYRFSPATIQSAVNALKNIADTGLVQTNEEVYNLLTMGKSFNETVDGDQKAYSLRYIDWENLENNVYHVTEEFRVEGINEKRRPDIVLFVNGIPFVIIENKRRDKKDPLGEAISQSVRNQRKDEGVPRLFHYAQLLMAVQPNGVKYATVGTQKKFWGIWREDNVKETQRLIRSKAFGAAAESRLATHQDQSLASLCRPSRLMELVYKFIVFDRPSKKIARYQQYFAVQKTLKVITEKDQEQKRKGGVIYHTQGSGKSLTMVMLSKAIALEKSIENPRVIVVTDRISLDKQIYKTFFNCQKNVEKARSGNHLIELLKDKGVENITTILDKFRKGAKRGDFKDTSTNLFVLVDESHRSQYGSAHAQMRRIMPNACYIGFTGTPLLSDEKNTANKFGGFIDEYTMERAVKDKAVLPLLYEGRLPKLSINRGQIDKGFERLSTALSEEATKDLKKKFNRISKIYESEQVINEIAYDISQHYCSNIQGYGLKAQLAVPRINSAVRYQKYFEEQTDPALKINTRVVFTPPDSRTDYDDVWKEANTESKQYWKQIVDRYGDQESYETEVTERFMEEGDEVELIIVVSKLLTGFDAPRNTVLYLAKPLMGHNLLQAIARVNRLFDGKDFGYVLDYVGLLGDLDEALTAYSALEDYDPEDLKSAVKDIREEVRKVPHYLEYIWDLFKGVNRNDLEAMERHLDQKDLRDSFHERVLEYFKALQIALASDSFYDEFTESQISHFLWALKYFKSMRSSVQMRYAEIIDTKEYEPKVRKLMDTYVTAEEVEYLTGEVNIFDKNMVEEALERYGKTPASKADMIANRMKKVITENLEKDETYYKKFSELLEETIKAFKEGRIDEKEYLDRILKTRDQFEEGKQEGIPELISENTKARAFFNKLCEVLIKTHEGSAIKEAKPALAMVSLRIQEIVEKLTIRDWKRNSDIQNQMENAIEDYLMENRKSLGLQITFDEMDEILVACLKVAKKNY